MTQELPLISTPDAILRIKKLIENKQGDAGRLQYISERLQSGKKLFHSDHIYLTNKISAEVIPIEIKEPNENDKKIKDVKRLIALKLGEPGRLAYILKTLEKSRDLYHSDEIYLNNKIEQFHEYTEGKRIKRRVRRASEPEHLEEIKETSEILPKEKPHPEPFEDIPKKLQGIEDAVLSEKPKKTSDLFDLIDETPEVDLEIQQEREKISKLKANHEQIKIQHDELSQLIAYRQEYEQKKVKEKDELVAQLIKNQSKLLQSKTEREVLLEQIKIDKEKSEKQLVEMQGELDELKEEYKVLQKEIKSKKENLEKQIRDQKEKNNKLKEESEEE